MAIPDYQTLMLPVVQSAAGGEMGIGDAIERLAKEFRLTDAERAELLPSGKQTIFRNRVHWAKTYLIKAGLLHATRRGYFAITERQLDLLDQDVRRPHRWPRSVSALLDRGDRPRARPEEARNRRA